MGWEDLLHECQHSLGMRLGIDLREGVRNDAVFVDDVGDAAGIAGIPGTVCLAQRVIGVAE